MMEINTIWNENCLDTMEHHIDAHSIDIVITSPPYNTARKLMTERSLRNHESRYDSYIDSMPDDKYCEFTNQIFNGYDKILKENGVVLYNISYGSGSPNTMWLAISDIIRNTEFMVGDCIIWKKKSALPNNTSRNKLTRITEFVFCFCRKKEYKTYQCNKEFLKCSSSGQPYYSVMMNYIEAANNDGPCKLNKATFSSELVMKIIDMYCSKNGLVYDSFIGSGTTAVAAIRRGMNFIGSELSEAQCEYAIKRVKKEIIDKFYFKFENNEV